MKVVILFFGLFVILSFSLSILANEENVVQLEFYHQKGCSLCKRIKDGVLHKAQEEFKIDIKYYDTSEEQNFLKLLSRLEQFKDKSNESAYIVINQKTLLAGENIETDLLKQLKSVSLLSTTNEKEMLNSNTKKVIFEASEDISLYTVLIAGLIDGINPCVFSTLILFLSFLSVSRVKNNKLLILGTVYCIGCFLTYYAIGFGIIHLLACLLQINSYKYFLNIGIITILLFFAIMSFADAWNFHKTKNSKKVRLKLPAKLQNRIHSIIRKGIKYRFLIPGIFFTSIFVTIFEGVCTGQVYLPTLVFLTKDLGLGSKWAFYLFLYNFMFVLPLIIIFICFYLGISKFKLIDWSKQNVVFSKILLGLFFIALGTMFFLSEYA
ncbi:MAG: hypothetical protein WCS27_00340 [Victivallaceae bacterium]